MSVDPANTHELAEIASEIGAYVPKCDLRYPSETGGWQVGDLDLSEYLDNYRDQQVVVIIVPIGQRQHPPILAASVGLSTTNAGNVRGGSWPQSRAP